MGLQITWANILVYAASLAGLFLISKFFAVPLKWLLRLAANALLGGLALVIFNAIAGQWGLQIGVNLATSVCLGLLGVPGFLLLLIFRLLL